MINSGKAVATIPDEQPDIAPEQRVRESFGG